MWFGIFYIHSTALIRDHLHLYVCLHLLFPWNTTNNEERQKQTSPAWIKHCLLILGMGGYFPSNVSRAGDSSVVTLTAPDLRLKSPGFKSLQEQQVKSPLQVKLSVLTLTSLSSSLPSHVTVVALKRSQSFCQKCRWQVTAKHTCMLPMKLWMKWHCKLVHGCMVYREPVPRWQQFHMAPAMQPPNSACSEFTTLCCYFYDTVTHSESQVTWMQWVCLRAENSSV